MLTRDLLRYRVRRGDVHPQFVEADDPELLAYARAVLQEVGRAAAMEEPRAAVDEAMAACEASDIDMLVARGLRKLVTDACRYADPDPDAPALRAQVFAQATAMLRDLPENTGREDFCRRLARDCADTTRLYNDLPQERRLTAFTPLEPVELLQRYNMAQVQGLAIACKSLRIRTPGGDVRAVRRVLRHLKFCRLIAEIKKHDDGGWDMHVTGPADMFAHAKKYGLQLAMFVPVIPVLTHYTLEADVALRPGTPARRLSLSQAAPLVSAHKKRLGYTPPELQHIVKTFEDPHWRLDPRPPPRPVGPRDFMLPDFACAHTSGLKVAVELFHPWHRHALTARLEQLRDRPANDVLVGVDKSLTKLPAVIEALAHTPGTPHFVFNAFPTAKKLRESLCLFIN